MVEIKAFLSPEVFEADPLLLSYARFAVPLTLTALSVDEELGLSPHVLSLNEIVDGNPISQEFREALVFATTNILTERRCGTRDVIVEKLKRNGKVISFDGINGAGKTTLIRALGMERCLIKREDRSSNIAAAFLRGKFLPDTIRLKGLNGISETLLLSANLYYQLAIQPREGVNIIDRGTLSFFAYQTYVLMQEYEVDRESAQNYLKILLSGISHPDVSYFLDVDLDTAAQRVYIHQNDRVGYEQIRTNFFNGLALIPNCHILDATGELAGIVNNFRNTNQ